MDFIEIGAKLWLQFIFVLVAVVACVEISMRLNDESSDEWGCFVFVANVMIFLTLLIYASVRLWQYHT